MQILLKKMEDIFLGKEGTGVTQIAKWLSWHFTAKEKRKENSLFIFSTETTVNDMIRKFSPKADSKDSTPGIFEWKMAHLLWL